MVLAVRPANVWMTYGAGTEASEHWGKRAPVRELWDSVDATRSAPVRVQRNLQYMLQRGR